MVTVFQNNLPFVVKFKKIKKKKRKRKKRKVQKKKINKTLKGDSVGCFVKGALHWNEL